MKYIVSEIESKNGKKESIQKSGLLDYWQAIALKSRLQLEDGYYNNENGDYKCYTMTKIQTSTEC